MGWRQKQADIINCPWVSSFDVCYWSFELLKREREVFNEWMQPSFPQVSHLKLQPRELYYCFKFDFAGLTAILGRFSSCVNLKKVIEKPFLLFLGSHHQTLINISPLLISETDPLFPRGFFELLSSLSRFSSFINFWWRTWSRGFLIITLIDVDFIRSFRFGFI